MPVEPAVPESVVPSYLVEDPRDRRRLRLAVVAALACHLSLLLLPKLGGEVAAAAVVEPPVRIVPAVRFRPPAEPPTPAEPAPVSEERALRVPVPQPTAVEPEPLRELELPPLPEPVALDVVFVPPAPPEPEVGPPALRRVGGEIGRPRQLYAPYPVYTEAARRARLQGTVILEVRLDEAGRVADVTVLRGQPLGLTESAVEAVSRWRYEPARLAGRAVPVLMTVTVHFELS